MMMMTMMMMMTTVSVSAGPLPPSLSHSRQDIQDYGSLHQLLQNKDENSTRFESRRVNETQDDARSDAMWNDTDSIPTIYTLRHCLLPTCLTANLGSSLQFGDETAGVSTRDPEGIGKK
ncbi:uncharacterized protein LOC118291083 isoform X2 [Scophthalmus maximus]|uniref:uncharacterized protein LOC118291083 isoform X2 n=1 Tax=Scophthalmus maximus TaxID=52904 RepID=UPI0015E14073|nr:uncharacterized protein LOC118291083 isoform X2 [Scophthalmus maximus]